MKEKNAIINDKLGGANSLPIKYVRESLWESENPVIKFLRTYLGQIIMALVTYILFKRVIGGGMQMIIVPMMLEKGIVGIDKVVALACMP